MQKNGFILFNKEPGVTSFRSLNPIKRQFGKGVKLGHTGTLDQFAEGLMILLVGKLTRLNGFFSNLDKEYEATIVFGTETATLDPEGEVVDTKPLPSRVAIEAALTELTGKIEQEPPHYSAIHIDGARASDRLRRGEEFAMPKRMVTIYHTEIISLSENDAGAVSQIVLKIACSKGTYIRSFARDLGRLAQSCAYVERLKRLAVGQYRQHDWTFGLDNAVTQADFKAEEHLKNPYELIAYLPDLGYITLKKEYEARVANGNSLEKSWTNLTTTTDKALKALLFSENREFLAALERNTQEEEWRYQFVCARTE